MHPWYFCWEVFQRGNTALDNLLVGEAFLKNVHVKKKF